MGFPYNFNFFWRHGTCISNLLCCKEEDSIGHMYFIYEYTRKILILVLNSLNLAMWRIQNRPAPGSTDDIKICDITKAIQRFTYNASFWGIYWPHLSFGTSCVREDQDYVEQVNNGWGWVDWLSIYAISESGLWLGWSNELQSDESFRSDARVWK